MVVFILCCVWQWGRSSLLSKPRILELFSACAGVVLCKVLICHVTAVIRGCMCVCVRVSGSVV